MTRPERDLPPVHAQFGQLEEAFIDEFLQAHDCDRARLASMPLAEREALLKAASIYASSKLAEVDSWSRLLREMHGRGGSS